MQIIRGKQKTALKVVVYGPEGIGKSTFAAQFPNPLFIDTEGGTKHMDVARTPKPTSWVMLLGLVKECIADPSLCGTLIIDTMDWAELLCSRYVCDKAQKKSIEEFGYGKGYTYLMEEFGALLNTLNELVERGVNVVVTAHAKMRKFEQPDELGAYDRWEMKLSAKTAPLVKEWADMVLFANYKTFAVKTENGKTKGQGGERRMYTTHHPCWDAKNRFGLPDEMPFDYAGIAACIPGTTPAPAPQPEPPAETVPKALLVPDLIALGVPEKLAPLMSANNVTPEELQAVVGKRGYFPEDMPIRDYPADFVEGCLVAAWPQVLQMVLDSRDLPF